MKNSTNPLESQLAVTRATKSVMDAIRSATSGVPKPDDTYLRNLKGDCLSRPDRPRDLPVEGMVALLFDAFQKGVRVERLQEVPEALSKALHSWAESTPVELNPDVAHLYEERAEALAEIAEAEARIDQSGPVLHRLRTAHRAHFIARENYIRSIESGSVA